MSAKISPACCGVTDDDVDPAAVVAVGADGGVDAAACTYKHLLRESVRQHPEAPIPFESMVGGDDALIPVGRLRFVKRVGSGAFARGEWGGVEGHLEGDRG